MKSGGRRRKLEEATLFYTNNMCIFTSQEAKGQGNTLSGCAAWTLAEPLCSEGNGFFMFYENNGDCRCCKTEVFDGSNAWKIYKAAPVTPSCSITSKSSIPDLEISADATLPVDKFFEGTSEVCKVEGCKI